MNTANENGSMQSEYMNNEKLQQLKSIHNELLEQHANKNISKIVENILIQTTADVANNVELKHVTWDQQAQLVSTNHTPNSKPCNSNLVTAKNTNLNQGSDVKDTANNYSSNNPTCTVL